MVQVLEREMKIPLSDYLKYPSNYLPEEPETSHEDAKGCMQLKEARHCCSENLCFDVIAKYIQRLESASLDAHISKANDIRMLSLSDLCIKLEADVCC